MVPSCSINIIVRNIKSEGNTKTPHICNPIWEFRCDLLVLGFEVISDTICTIDQTLFPYDVVLCCSEKSADRVTHPCIKVPVREFLSELIGVIKPASLHLL